MRIVDILSSEQVSVSGEAGRAIRTKADAIGRLADLLAGSQGMVAAPEINIVLSERETLQSTGVGGGVAIPHGTIERLDRIYGAVLLCPDLVGFDAIDGEPVGIFFAVIGPKKSTGQHLKTLARVSRLLRDAAFRNKLVDAKTGSAAFLMIEHEEARVVTA